MEGSNAVSFGASLVTSDRFRGKKKLEEMIEAMLGFRRLYNQINSGTILMMMLVARFPGFSINNLGKMANMDKSSTSRHVQLLEGMGLIKKTVDPDSLRVRRCVLTEAGENFIKEVCNAE